MKSPSTTNLAETIPVTIRELLGPPPLVSAESEALYYGMIASFAEFVKPTNLIAWMLIKDLADARVDIARYRKFKNELINEPSRSRIRAELAKWEKRAETIEEEIDQESQKEIDQYIKVAEAAGKDAAEIDAGIDRILESYDQVEEDRKNEALEQIELWKNAPTTERDLAVTLNSWIEKVQQIDVLLVAAEERFSTALSELDRFDRVLARRVRDHVIDGEVVDTTSRASAKLPALQ